MNSLRDFLTLPDGQAVTITLKYNTGQIRNGKFGRFFVYTVIHNGVEKFLKVTDRLEKQFRKRDVKAGQEIQLRKDVVTPSSGESYGVANLISVGAEKDTINGQPTSINLPDELRLLSQALSDSQAICKNTTRESIMPEVTLAVGLFLARTIRLALQADGRPTRQKTSTGKARTSAKVDGGKPAIPIRPADDLPF